ncbi:MAG: hypothetical protein WDW38_000731 [Sanguina aurantia]
MAPRKKDVAAAADAPAGDVPAKRQAPTAASKKRGAEKLDAGVSSPSKQSDLASQKGPAPAAEPSIPSAQAPVPKRRRVAAKGGLFPASRPALDLFVFGSNPFGALGLGEDETVKYRPAAVEVEGVQFVQIATGGMHTVALSSTGEVWTWGVNDEGALGRITQGGNCWESAPEDQKQDPSLPGKAALPGDILVTSIAAGDGFTFALGTDGAVYGCGCFKDDVGGTSGFSPAAHTQKTFTSVLAPASSRDHVRSLLCGARHAVALTARGEIFTWGIASQGQLGRVPAFDSATTALAPEVAFVPQPTPSLTSILGSSPVVAIGCGSYSTFAISKAGDVAGWGLNNSAQLGLPKASDNANFHWQPELLPSLVKIASIKGGEQHTLAITKAGKVLSFGAPTYGMLGRSGVDVACANVLHPEPAEVEGLEGLTGACVAAGTNVSAACMSDGSLWLWGANVTFQLAKGDDDGDEIVPAKLRRTKTFGFRKVHQVCFGGQHAALLAGPPEVAATPAAAAPAAVAVPAEAAAPAQQ